MEAADLVSNAVLPDEAPEEIAPEDTASLAANLAELAGALEESAAHAGEAAQAAAGAPAGADPAAAAMPMAAPPMAAPPAAAPPTAVPEGEAAKAASAGEAETAKAASVTNAGLWLQQKLSESGTGSTITGTKPEQENTIPTSEQGEAVLEALNRPGGKGYANVGVTGVGTQEASGEGAVGAEGEHPGTAGPVAETKDNSAIEATKNAAAERLLNMVNKLAMGSTITGKDPGQNNELSTVAPVTGEGQLEGAARPHNYANKGVAGVGKSDEAAKARAAAIGDETPHPGQEGHGGKSTNTVINQSKSAAENEYLEQFQTVADKYAAYLPPRLNDVEKVAALKYIMSLDPVSRDKVAMYMDKTAELPEALKAYVKGDDEGEKDGKKDKDEKKDKDGKKDKEKDEEKDEKKEAAISAETVLSQIRNVIQG